MKFKADSKEFADLVNTVSSNTGSSTVNMEVGKKGLLLLKSSNKGFAHHLRTDIIVDEGAEGVTATVPVAQFLGMINRRGLVTIEVTDTNSLYISNKSFRGEINLAPPTDVDDIEASKETLELEGETLSKLKEHLPGLSIQNLFSDNQPFVRIQCKKGSLEIMTMDTVHGVYYKIPSSGQSDFAFDLPHDSLATLISIIEDNADAVFAVEESRVFVSSVRTSMSFPKQQVAKLIPIKSAIMLRDKCLAAKNPSTLGSLHLETLLQEVQGCKHIAADNTTVSLEGGKGSYVLTYITPHGRIKSKGKCESTWAATDVIKVSPFLLEDFLNSMSLSEIVDLKVVEKTVFSYMEKENGYEAFHICSGN